MYGIPCESTSLFLIHPRDKIMLASWRGTRFECVQVLRGVCDRVLKDPKASDNVLLNRAKVLLVHLTQWGTSNRRSMIT